VAFDIDAVFEIRKKGYDVDIYIDMDIDIDVRLPKFNNLPEFLN
jgi:hypothetical protein